MRLQECEPNPSVGGKWALPRQGGVSGADLLYAYVSWGEGGPEELVRLCVYSEACDMGAGSCV